MTIPLWSDHALTWHVHDRQVNLYPCIRLLADWHSSAWRRQWCTIDMTQVRNIRSWNVFAAVMSSGLYQRSADLVGRNLLEGVLVDSSFGKGRWAMFTWRYCVELESHTWDDTPSHQRNQGSDHKSFSAFKIWMMHVAPYMPSHASLWVLWPLRNTCDRAAIDAKLPTCLHANNCSDS